MALTSPRKRLQRRRRRTEARTREQTQKLQPPSKRELLNGIKRSGNKSTQRGFCCAMHEMGLKSCTRWQNGSSCRMIKYTKAAEYPRTDTIFASPTSRDRAIKFRLKSRGLTLKTWTNGGFLSSRLFAQNSCNWKKRFERLNYDLRWVHFARLRRKSERIIKIARLSRDLHVAVHLRTMFAAIIATSKGKSEWMA